MMVHKINTNSKIMSTANDMPSLCTGALKSVVLLIYYLPTGLHVFTFGIPKPGK